MTLRVAALALLTLCFTPAVGWSKQPAGDLPLSRITKVYKGKAATLTATVDAISGVKSAPLEIVVKNITDVPLLILTKGTDQGDIPVCNLTIQDEDGVGCPRTKLGEDALSKDLTSTGKLTIAVNSSYRWVLPLAEWFKLSLGVWKVTVGIPVQYAVAEFKFDGVRVKNLEMRVRASR